VNILVIKRDKIGDLLLTTPMLRQLRQQMPQAQIHMLCSDYNAWVVADNPDVDRVWMYRRTRVGKQVRVGAALAQVWQLLKLRRCRFDVALVAGGEESARGIRRAAYAGAARTIGYCKSAHGCKGLTDPVPEPVAMHEIERMLNLLGPLGISAPSRHPCPEYRLPCEWNDWAQGWLKEQGLERGAYVVLGLGARRAKRQPGAEQVLCWSAWLKRRHGLDTVFMWTPGKSDNPVYPGDDAVAAPVVAQGVDYIHPFRAPLMPALGLVWNARTSIFPDSGLMHFAAASEGGVLGLFADPAVSPPPDRWAPRGRRSRYLVAATDVRELDDEEVYRRLDELLC